MFCSKCGAYNDDNANSCSICKESFVDLADMYEENSYELNAETITNPPKTYFFASVILAMLGSFIFGIVAMVMSVMVDVNIESDKLDMAERYSNKTKLFCLISLFVGIIKYISLLFWWLVF